MTIRIGDLVEHCEYPGYRGIVREVLATRGNGKARTIKVSWFPPLSDASPKQRWQTMHVEGTTSVSVLDVRQISALGT